MTQGRIWALSVLAAAGCGSGNAAPPVGDCSDLPAVGVWQDITPDRFHNPSNMQTNLMAIDPRSQTVFASAQNKTNGGDGSSGLYASTDCGRTFTLVSTGQGASVLQGSSPWSIAIDPQDPQTMYLGAGYGGLTIFKSTDGGADWTPLTPDPADVLTQHGGFVQAIALDPTDPSHIVLTFHDDCTAIYNKNCMSQSYDGGTTWQEFSGPSDLDGWQESASISVLGPSRYFYAAAGAYKGYLTTDAGQTWTKVIDGPLYAAYVPSVHVVPDGTAFVGMLSTGVFYSQDQGASWTQMPGLGSATAVIDDGTNLYATSGYDHSGKPYYLTPLAGATGTAPVWTHMDNSASIIDGSIMLAYDPVHHVIYSANMDAGLWRLHTE
jgi:photosystem II stability/assembly factor-like uncharacterized protein